MTKYDKYSKEQLIQHIEELEKQLKSTKYGLYYDKSIERERVVEQITNTIPTIFEVDSCITDKAESNHILVEGDNFHSLTLLSMVYQFRGIVDIIYIDPPYNTGNDDFSYNDKYVNSDDGYKHSKWLTMIEKRLLLAKEMLTNRGVIFISIDDNEQANLKLLCDSIFGERNFIATFVWSAGRKNDSKFVSVSHEYILCYVKSLDYLAENKIIWRSRKPGLDEIYTEYRKLLKTHGSDYKTMTEELKQWYRDLPESSPAKGHAHYKAIDKKGIFFPSDISWPGGGGPKYQVIHPTTGKPVKIPERGWVYPTSERMQEIINQDLVFFGEDETSVPCKKSYLDDNQFEAPYSVFYKDGRAATKALRKLLGKDGFDFPKDVEVIKNLIRFCSTPHSIVFDFYAGSGTTGQAVLELNQEDGGNRRFILCTNNENNICTEVTYPRLKTVITGIRPDGTKYSDGIPANLHYFKCDFIPNVGNADQAKYNLVEKVNNLLCIAEDVYDLVDSSPRHYVYQSNDTHKQVFMYIDYYEEKSFNEFKKKIVDSKAEFKVVYMFSTDNVVDDLLFKDIKGVEIKPIPSKIYEIYKDIVEDIKRG